MKRSATVAIGLVLMVVGLLLMTAGVLLLALAPAQYEATARIAVEKLTTNATGSNTAGFDPFWMEGEMRRIQSTPVLRAAITNLKIDQLWTTQQKLEAPLSMEETERQLKERLKVLQNRGTSMFEISFRAYEPNEAALLANGVAQAFASDHSPKEAKVEIVDTAIPPAKPQRQKQPMAIILFLGGAAMMLAGYVILRPHLDKISPASVQRP
jgi:uncharacterized protein involved in exopolysaccharide biosynthesis